MTEEIKRRWRDVLAYLLRLWHDFNLISIVWGRLRGRNGNGNGNGKKLQAESLTGEAQAGGASTATKIGAVYDVPTGELRRLVVPNSDDKFTEHVMPGEAIVFIENPAYALKTAEDVFRAIEQASGIIRASRVLLAIVDDENTIINVIRADRRFQDPLGNTIVPLPLTDDEAQFYARQNQLIGGHLEGATFTPGHGVPPPDFPGRPR